VAYNVLIVDDSQTMRKVILKAVALSGFDLGDCWEAGDGREAISILANHWVDLILTDLYMPGMNGLELTEKLRKDYPALKILIITSHDRNTFYARAIKAGADEMVEKGSTDEMLKKIKRALDK